jgi:hypothetical protein
MAGNGSTGIPVENNKRVSDTLLRETASNHAGGKQMLSQHSSFTVNVRHHKATKKRGRLEESKLVSKLPIEVLFSTKKRRLSAPYFQPESIKRIRNNPAFSTHKCESDSTFPSATRLALQARSLSSIFSPQNKGFTQAISPPIVSRRAAGNDVPPFWTKHLAESICVSFELDSPENETSRHAYRRIPGRFSFGSPGRGSTAISRPDVSVNPADAGLEGQLRKVSVDTSKEPHLLRYTLGPMVEPEMSASGQDSAIEVQNFTNVDKLPYEPERPSESSRPIEFRQFHCASRETKLSSPIEYANKSSEFASSRLTFLTRRGQSQSKVVVNEQSSSLKNIRAPGDSLLGDRCIERGLGSTGRQCTAIRAVEHKGKADTFQSQGNVSGSQSSGKEICLPEGQLHITTMRQPVCGGLSSKPGGHEILSSSTDNTENFSYSGSESNYIDPLLHSRQIQSPCRPLVSSQDTPGMAHTAKGDRNSISQIWGPGHRSIFVKTGSCCGQLCISRSPGQSGTISRCLLKDLALPTSVGLSTPISDTESADSHEYCKRPISPGSASLGASILESRPQVACHSSTIHDTTPPTLSNRRLDGASASGGAQNDSRSMDMWGWQGNLTNWNIEQKRLLESSWRVSTRRTYRSAWNRWLMWTKKHNVDPFSPGGSNLARYLADLYLIENLSYNTIMLHKSAISTICNADDSGQLSSHAIVRHVLKSIALKQPDKPKPSIWNADVLTCFLENYTVEEGNTFAVVRHTATLLLLCSGRRVHDLTLLSIDTDHVELSEEFVLFRPVFGSKTDSTDYRQSGWKLTHNRNNVRLDPVYWINQTISLLRERRGTGNCFNLFVTIRGLPKPASRTVIAGWVKTVLVEAGIVATPGSMRSAVASKNWFSNVPVDEILAKGNWRSGNTFRKFYRREIMSAPTNSINSRNNVTQLFNAVD